MSDSTTRFSSRVENYIKYRPHYPAEFLHTLKEECELKPDSVIADIGSGTGILTEVFLNNGNIVFGVEPNREMREAGEKLLGEYSFFRSISGIAEETTLEDHSMDFVTAAQAYHWFDHAKARQEFLRILKPHGWVVLLWNDRRMDSPFLQEYEHLLQLYATDYAEVNHKQFGDEQIGAFFGEYGFRKAQYVNSQYFDFDGLKGRLLSSSYTPEEDHRNYAPMLERLRTIFDAHQINGQVSFDYDTIMFYGQLS